MAAPSGTRSDFTYTGEPEPHSGRAREILRRHPEIRELIRPNPRTFWWAVGLVAFQMTIAAWLAHAPWWAVALVAYFVGAFVSHALGVLIHECAHRLVFRPGWASAAHGNARQSSRLLPELRLFQTYHLKHHAYLGVYEIDGDVPSRWEAKLAGRSAIGKALWLLLFPLIQLTRLYRLKGIQPIDGWMDVISRADRVRSRRLLVLRPRALVYLVLSLYFSISLHFLGGRWVQEHFLPAAGAQETFSYYGPMNRLTFNVATTRSITTSPGCRGTTSPGCDGRPPRPTKRFSGTGPCRSSCSVSSSIAGSPSIHACSATIAVCRAEDGMRCLLVLSGVPVRVVLELPATRASSSARATRRRRSASSRSPRSCPADWEVRLVDCNVERWDDAMLDWADVVLTGGMMPQQRDCRS